MYKVKGLEEKKNSHFFGWRLAPDIFPLLFVTLATII